MPILALVMALLLAGCVGAGMPRDLGAVAVEEQGQILPRPDGNGPPIECRGLPRSRCEGPGSIQDGDAGHDLASVERVIVSCIGVCTSTAGAFRVDLVVDGRIDEVARGGYGSAP